MNKIYRIVWNPALQAWVAVSEFAKAKGKGKNGRNRLATTAAGVAGALALVLLPVEDSRAWVAGTGTSSATLDGNISSNTSINGGKATGAGGGNFAAGAGAVASGNANSFAIGSLAQATDTGAMAIGFNAEADYLGVALGANSIAGREGVAVGTQAQAYGMQDVAIGWRSYANGMSSGATAIGSNVTANGRNSMALGNELRVNAQNGLAIAPGYVDDLSLHDTIDAASNNGLVIGSGAWVANAPYGTAIGERAMSGAMESIAFGHRAKATATSGIAFGTDASVSVADGVALGSNAKADTALGIVGYSPAGAPSPFQTAVNNTVSTKGAIAIGDTSAGYRRQITDVAAGSADTDAVNVAQLKALGASPLGFQGNTGATTKILGSTMVIKGGKTTAGTYSDKNMNTVVDAAGNLNIQMADNPVFNSVIATDGTNTTTMAANGLTVTGGPSVTTTGINAGGKKVTNVADGLISATSTDAINGSQLNAVATNPLSFAGNTGTIAKTLGSTMVIKGGKTTAGTYSDKNMNTVVDAAGNLNIQMADNPVFNSVFATDGTNTTIMAANGLTVTGGPSVTTTGINAGGKKVTNVADGLISATSSDAINGSQLWETRQQLTHYYSVNDNGIQGDNYANDGAKGLNSLAAGVGATAFNTNDVALGSGSQTAAAVGTKGVVINDLNYRFAGTTPTSTVSVGSLGNERTITNVAAGRLSETSTDAINGSQLYATNMAIENIGDNVGGLNDRTLKYDWTDTNGDGLVQPDEVNYGKATLAGPVSTDGGKTGGTKITNLAQGDVTELSTDAINGSQLYAIAGDTRNEYTEENGRGIRYVRTNDTGLPVLDAYANGQGSSALGYNARATGASSLALGRDARSFNEGDVALGSGSVTEAAVATTGVTINGLGYHFAGVDPLSTVSVGSRGHERTITNVAAGRISADSTDAINGSQLYATNAAITGLDKGAVKYVVNNDGSVDYNNVVMGGDTYNSTTKTGGTRITNVSYGEAPSDAVNVQQLTDVVSEKTKYFHANSTKVDSVASGKDSIAVGPNAQSLGGASIAMGDDAKSTGKGSTAIGQGAHTIGDKSVALGSGAVASNANDVALGSGSVTQAAVATSKITINGDTYAVAGKNPTSTVSVGNAGNERTITNVAAGRISADSTDAVNGSELYATNKAVEKISTKVVEVETNRVKYDTHVDGTVNYNNVTMGGDTYNNTTHTGGTTITNVANGKAPSDAVNKYQLDQVDQHVTNISNGTDGMFQVNNTSKLPKPKPTGKDSTAGGAGAVASGDHSTSLGAKAKATHNNSVALGYNSVTDRDNSISVGSAGHERQITNVAAGTEDTDAANVGQLKQGVKNSYQYTNKKFNDLKNMVDDQKDKLSAGIAGAMATAGLPQPYEAGASMVGLAGGTYQGESAIALGVSTISDNGKWVTKIAGNTNSQGDVGASVGVGYQF